VPKSGHVTITKNENLHIDTQKNSLIQKMLFFSIYDEKLLSYRGKTVSEQWRHRRLWTLGRLE